MPPIMTTQEFALPEQDTVAGEIEVPAAVRFDPAETVVGRRGPAASWPTEPGTVPGTLVDHRALPAADPPTATIQESLDDEDALVRRLERDPDDPVAGDLLEAIYTRRGEREEVVGLLLDRAEATSDPAQRAGFLVRAAHIYRTGLGDLDAAGMVLVTALGAAPGDRRIHEELDALVCASGEFGAARAAFADAALALSGSDRALAGELWLRVASLHVMERGSSAAACAALARIEQLDLRRAEPVLSLCERLAEDVSVLDGLVAVYVRLGQLDRVHRVLALSIARVAEPERRAERHHAVAELAIGAGDDLEAEWHLAEALRLAPSRARSRTVLADLYRRKGQPRRAARLLEEAQALEHNEVDRADLACQAAAIYAEELGERTRAVRLYEQVIASDPERADAAAPLAERYWQRGAYAQLEPIIEMLARSALASGRPAEIAEQCHRAGVTALELDRPDRALGHLRGAHRAAPGRLDILCALARAAARSGEPGDVSRAAHAGLALAAEAPAAAGLADALAGLGEAAAAAGQADLALELHLTALSRAPAHEAALAAAAGLLEERGDHAGAARLLAAAADAAPSAGRAAILVRLAAVQGHALGDRAAAIHSYREALRHEPGHHAALSGLAELCAAAQQWREAVDALSALAALEDTPLRRGRYLQIAGQLARRRLPDAEAAGLFGRALDSFFAAGDPPADQRDMCMRAFRDLEAFLREQGAFKELERAYRAMIKRLRTDAAELPELWERLGALYRDQLGQPLAAAESYELAATLDRERDGDRILIEAYEGLPAEELAELVARRRRLLEREPLTAEHYRALAYLERRAGRADHAFLALRALDALDAASPEERDRVRRLEAGRAAWPTAPIDRELRARLRHPEEDARLTGILALATDAIAGELAAAPRRLGLRDDTSPTWQPLRDLHDDIARHIGVPAPQLHVCPELDVELVFANLSIDGRPQLALAAGRRVLGASRPQIIHALTRALAFARPAYSLCVLLAAPGALAAALDAALLVGGYRHPLAATPAAAQFAGSLDRRLSPGFRTHLSSRVAALDEPREALDVERWAEAVASAARRTALLLCDDLRTAAAALGRELTPTRRSREERLADLLVHSCSEDHAAVRAALGLAVE